MPSDTTLHPSSLQTFPSVHRHSPVSWAAVFAGAAVAAALSLILLALGSGLGFSSVSPWAYSGASAKALGLGAAAWLLLMSAAASGLGGYLAGRLRTRWSDVDSDEVYFRDTAHGLLAWSIATIASAALLATAASSMVGTAASAGAVTAGVAAQASSEGDRGYVVDMLLRSAQPPTAGSAQPGTAQPPEPGPGPEGQASRMEVGRIVSHSLVAGELTSADRTYLSSLVQRRTGLTAEEANKRIDTVIAETKAAADTARKAVAYTALWVFISLLVGAFCAAYAAMVGGRQRTQ